MNYDNLMITIRACVQIYKTILLFYYMCHESIKSRFQLYIHCTPTIVFKILNARFIDNTVLSTTWF